MARSYLPILSISSRTEFASRRGGSAKDSENMKMMMKKKNSTLTALDISGNKFGDEGRISLRKWYDS